MDSVRGELVVFFGGAFCAVLVWRFFMCLGMLVEDCAYLPAIAQAVGAIPSESSESNKVDSSEDNAVSEPTDTPAPSAPDTATFTISATKKLKAKDGSSRLAILVLEDAIYHQTHEELVAALEPYCRNAEISQLLKLPEDQLRSTIQALLKQMQSN